jgi:hypothetical protein
MHSQIETRSTAWICIVTSCVGFSLTSLTVFAEDVPAGKSAPTIESLRKAIDKSLPLLEKGAKGSLAERKQCFTCHNQGLPIQALTTARIRGFQIDDEHLKTQVQFTADFLAKNKSNYLAGKGQGGQIDTAGYALWALDNGGHQPDELTAAVAEYLLTFQKEKEHWQPQSRRPPSEQSRFTSTYLALRGLKIFGTAQQRERIDARFAQVQKWLIATTPTDTEDSVFRLRGLQLIGAPEDDMRRAIDVLVKSQREDGGWSQLPDLASDAYATGSVLVALHQSGGLPVDDPAYRKGLGFLLTNQLEDGSWHVTSRSDPFQTYYESGYPHGKDQFISIAAAGWATTALALALPEQTRKADAAK